MSIESLGLNRPAVEPARTRRTGRPERGGPSAPPSGRRFDAAEVRGDRPPQPPRASSTEESLQRLHERGLLDNVSRPLGQGEKRTADEELAMIRHSIDRMETLRPIPPEAQREPDAELRFPVPGGHRRPEPMREPPMEEGRVYGRPRPEPPQRPDRAPQEDGMFTMRLFSPRSDTGRVLRIGDHEIPVEEDGSILAGMPDGTVRRITINQDKMDEMVANGEVWLNGKQVQPSKSAAIGVAPNAEDRERFTQAAEEVFRRQADLGADPKDAKAQELLNGSGFWGAAESSKRLLELAKELAGGDSEKLTQLRDALVKVRENITQEQGARASDVSAQTLTDTLKLLDEWAKETKSKVEDGGTAHVSVKTAEAQDEAKAAEEKAGRKPAATETGRASKGNPALVEQLKADLQRRQQQMLDMVRDMLGKQGKAVSGDGIWRTLASGNFKVDAKTKAEAQKNIAEDGYWGVEQTSDRIFQFAIGLAGSSPEMLNKMEEAFEKGYAAAEKKWGGALPAISQQTRARVHEKFDELRKQQNSAAASVDAKGDE